MSEEDSLANVFSPKNVGILASLIVGVLVAKKVILPSIGSYLRVKMQRMMYKNFINFQRDMNLLPDSDIDTAQSAFQDRNIETLFKILKKNANTAFGKENKFSSITTLEEFREQLPLTFYKAYNDEVELLCNGKMNITSSDRLLYFATSSGTTGKQKMIPVTTGSFDAVQSVVGGCMGATFQYLHSNGYNFTNSDRHGQIGYNPSDHKRTKGGIPYGPLSQINRALSGIPYWLTQFVWLVTGEINFNVTDKVVHFETNLLVQVLFCIITPELSTISLGFGSMLNHFFVLLKNHFVNLIKCIEDCSLTHENMFCMHIPGHVQRDIEHYMASRFSKQFRTKRVKELRQISGFDGIVRKLWPNILYVNTSVSGSFAVYESNIRFYLGDSVPLLGAVYISSEASMGFQYNIKGEYMFHPDSTFLEFIAENEINAENPKTLLVSELEVGERYELALTTQSGFYRYRVGDVVQIVDKANGRSDIPLFRIVYRTGSILDAYGEKTTEEHVEGSLRRTAKQFGCQLNNFTTFLQIDSSPVVYLIFVEFSRTLNAEEQTQLNTTVDKHLRDVHQFYNQCREQEKLGAVVCKAVSAKKFQNFTAILVENGTAAMQVKIPHLLTKPSYLDYFLSDEE